MALDLDWYLRVQRERHQRAHLFYASRYYMVTGPQLFLAACTSVVAAMWPTDSSNLHAGKIVAAMAGGVNTLLVALSSMFEWQAKKELHAQAAKTYDQLLTDFRFCVMWASRASEDPMEAKQKLSDYLQHAHKKLSEINASLPRPPDHIIREVARDFGDADGVLEGVARDDLGLAWPACLAALTLIAAAAAAWGVPPWVRPTATKHYRHAFQAVAAGAALALLGLACVLANKRRETIGANLCPNSAMRGPDMPLSVPRRRLSPGGGTPTSERLEGLPDEDSGVAWRQVLDKGDASPGSTMAQGSLEAASGGQGPRLASFR